MPRPRSELIKKSYIHFDYFLDIFALKFFQKRSKIGMIARLKSKNKIQSKSKTYMLKNMLLEFVKLDYIDLSKIKPNAELLKRFFFGNAIFLASKNFFEQIGYIIEYKVFRIIK